jgi:hypothetical protein
MVGLDCYADWVLGMGLEDYLFFKGLVVLFRGFFFLFLLISNSIKVSSYSFGY